MNQERRELIIKEIEHWRRSKLLPDQYCDFLMNLYMDHDTVSQSGGAYLSFSRAASAVQRASGKQWLLTFTIVTVISFVVLYFTVFHPAMQIAVVTSASAIFLWLGKRIQKRSEATGLTLTGIGMLILLGGGLYMLDLHGLSSWSWQTLLLSVCSAFWIIYGIAARISTLHLCGWLAFLLVYAAILSHFMIDPQWYEVQLYWLPAAILFGWSSWFVHRWFKPVSAVLFITCAVTWFMPELYTVLFLENGPWLQLQLLGKFTVGGGLLYALRKQWMVWVI